MSTTPEALTLGGLIAMRMPRDAEECRLTIRMENPGGLTAHQTVDVVSAQFGFDWEARQLVLTPSRPMSALSAQDLDDLRKSARAGQSWHAYQQHKRHSDEKDALRARLAAAESERDQLRAEVVALRGLKPEIPQRPPHHNDASYQHPSLPRYGLRWNGPGQPVSVPMEDGYWTPFHLALDEVEVQQADAERYRDIRDGNAGEYAICEWIDGEDGEGFYQDVRAPEVVDAAVDEARKG